MTLLQTDSAADDGRFLRRRTLRTPVDKHWRLRLTGHNNSTAFCDISDCSIGGLAVHGDNDVLQALGGVYLGQAQIEINARALCHVLVQVRHQRAAAKAGHSIAGLKLAFASAQDRAQYHNAVRQALFPHVRLGARFSQDVWRVLSEAGFFDLGGRHPLHFEHQKNAYLAFNARLDDAKLLGQQFVWRGEKRVEATLATIKPFATTHIMHHLARVHDGAQGQHSVRELLLCCLEMSRADTQTRCLVAYLNDSAAFSQHHALGFAKQRQDSGHVAALAARFYDVNSLCDATITLDPTLSMRPMRRRDEALVADAAQRLRGGLYAQAFDLTRQQLKGEHACQVWSQAGLQRERAVMLACGAKQKPLVAVILDRVAAGADLFGALDAMMLVPLQVDMANPEMQPVFELILAYAKNWFLLRGAGHFSFADLDASFGAIGPQGAVYRGSGAVWMVHRPLFGALQTYWQTHLTHQASSAALQ